MISITILIAHQGYDGEPYGPSTHETAIPSRTRRYLGLEFHWRCKMTGFVVIMWAIWGVLVVMLLALKLYTGRLSRDEDDQIFLDDAFDQMKTQQAAITAKVNKIQPLRKASMWLVVAASVFVIGYYAFDVAAQFK